MGKVPFSNKIDENFNEIFEKLFNQLGPPRYRILEAAIEAFEALPRDAQYRLRSLDPDERKPVLRLLSQIILENKTEAENPADVVARIDAAAKAGARRSGKRGHGA